MYHTSQHVSMSRADFRGARPNIHPLLHPGLRLERVKVCVCVCVCVYVVCVCADPLAPAFQKLLWIARFNWIVCV